MQLFPFFESYCAVRFLATPGGLSKLFVMFINTSLFFLPPSDTQSVT